MPNTGRPSRDCRSCKKRKLRCDLRRPSCGQCLRAKLVCPGLPDVAGLQFQNETLQTRTRAVFRPRSAAGPLLRMSRPEEFEAGCIFFAHYVCGVGQCDALGDLCSQATPGGVLATTVQAVSMTYTGFRCNDGGLVRKGIVRYAAALNLLRAALQDPAAAMEDSTLQAVLLLDIYEKISGPDCLAAGASLQASHSTAALKLITLRPRSSVFSPLGRKLYGRVISSLHINLGVLHEPMPEEALEMQRFIAAYAPRDDPSWKLASAFSAVLSFTGAMNFRRDARKDELLAQALTLYAQSIAATNDFNICKRRARIRVKAGGNNLIYGDYYDVYDTHHASWAAYVFYMMRIIPLSALISLFSPDSEVVSPADHVVYTQALQANIRDLVACVPQWIVRDLWPGNTTPFNADQLITCYPLLTFIWMAASASTDEDIRSWARGILEYMWREGGMEAATQVQLSTSDTYFAGSVLWRVPTMHGSHSFVACGPGTHGVLMRGLGILNDDGEWHASEQT